VEENRLNQEEAKSRAERAKQLLSDELLKGSLAALTESAIAACAQARDEKDAWRACMTLKACMDFARGLASHVETAKVIEFNQKPTLRERLGI
jgi:hypothetical protein